MGQLLSGYSRHYLVNRSASASTWPYQRNDDWIRLLAGRGLCRDPLGKQACTLGFNPGDVVFQLFLSATISYLHDCRSTKLGCVDCILCYGPGGRTTFSPSKTTRRR